MVQLYLPQTIKFSYINNIYIYIYNNKYSILLDASNYIIFFNKNIQIILMYSIFNKKKNLSINNFIFTWDNFFSTKLYFLGKGFKIRKFNRLNTFFLHFNHSHLNALNVEPSYALIKKVQKIKLLIFSKSITNINYLKKILFNIRNINSYTKRGIRYNKMLILKRRNKSSVH